MSTPTKPRTGGGRPYGGPGGQKKRYVRKKFCRFCAEKDLQLDYKNVYMFKHFVSERGKILPRRLTGTCAHHQHTLNTAIKRARNIAFLPFVAD